MRFTPVLIAAAVGYLAMQDGALAGGNREASDCGDPAILKTVAKRFHHQSHEVHHDRLTIDIFDDVHQHRYYPAKELRPIARRYCGATAVLSDGRRKTLWYFIETHAGFAGWGDNVEFCVSGFDKWNVYNAYCRVAR